MPVKIIADSTCDLSNELIKKYDIALAPLTVTLGDRSGYDGIDITPDDIYAYVDSSGELPKSSSVSVWDYQGLYKKWRDQGYEIVHINIGSNFSASYQNACIAAEAIGGVYPVDSANLSTGQGLMVLHAADLARSGRMSAETIAEECRLMAPRIEASFILNSTEYLHKGGRCSGVAALSASLLHIKVSIEVVNGIMKPGKKYHGKLDHAIRAYVEDRLKGRDDIDTKRIFLNHTRCDQAVIDEVRGLIRENCPDVEEILEVTAGSTITTHCGPETLAVMFVRKD